MTEKQIVWYILLTEVKIDSDTQSVTSLSVAPLAVLPEFQRKGYGKKLIFFLLGHYKARYHTMLVGTGDSPVTISFYRSCGFVYSHRIPNFFTDNYDHPIFEAGTQLKDMIYLKIDMSGL